MYKNDARECVVLLAHPGGPFYRNRDAGAWSIPKGELEMGEDAAAAARREFMEEIGTDPGDALTALGEIVQAGGKRVIAFAVQGDMNVDQLKSNLFDLEWPPRSGRMQSFPEVDRAEWMTFETARSKILPSQSELLDRLQALLRSRA